MRTSWNPSGGLSPPGSRLLLSPPPSRICPGWGSCSASPLGNCQLKRIETQLVRTWSTWPPLRSSWRTFETGRRPTERSGTGSVWGSGSFCWKTIWDCQYPRWGFLLSYLRCRWRLHVGGNTFSKRLHDLSAGVQVCAAVDSIPSWGLSQSQAAIGVVWSAMIDVSDFPMHLINAVGIHKPWWGHSYILLFWLNPDSLT